MDFSILFYPYKLVEFIQHYSSVRVFVLFIKIAAAILYKHHVDPVPVRRSAASVLVLHHLHKTNNE